MAWIFLIVAGFAEIGWPVGLKISQTAGGKTMFGIIIAVVSMMLSGGLLWLAQKDIPLGTAYAVWTGIGASGTFFIGVIFFGDSLSAGRITAVALIIAGIIGLKLSS